MWRLVTDGRTLATTERPQSKLAVAVWWVELAGVVALLFLMVTFNAGDAHKLLGSWVCTLAYAGYLGIVGYVLMGLCACLGYDLLLRMLRRL